MSDYDNGFARAQAMYDAQEPPDNSQDVCGHCGLVREEHDVGVRDGGHVGGVVAVSLDICDDGEVFQEQDYDEGPDPDDERDRQIDREMDPPEREDY